MLDETTGNQNKHYYTLQDYYDGLDIDSGEMLIGPVLLEIPPLQISISDSFAVNMTPGAIRQRSSIKVNKGKINRAISMTMYFLDSKDAGSNKNNISDLYQIINLFRTSPFVSIKNEYLNDVIGIDAIALVSMFIQSDREIPGAYIVQLNAEQFHYQCYVPDAQTFASIIDYNKYIKYLNRGLTQIEKEVNSGGLSIPTDHIHSDTDIDFLMHDIVPDAIAGGFGVWKDIQDTVQVPSLTLRELKKRFGEEMIDMWAWGISTDDKERSHWDPQKVNEVIETVRNYIGSINFNTIKNQIRNMLPPGTPEENINYLTVRYILQKLQTVIDKAEKDSGLDDIEHENPNETWIEEWAVPMVGTKLSDNVTVNSFSASITNYFARLPVLSHESFVHQYLGGGNMDLSISMEMQGEEDLKKLIRMIKRSQTVARLTKAIGTLGFFGIRSHISRVLGCKYWMPMNMTTDTNPEIPHVYNVSISFTDFDIYQQEKEQFVRQQISKHFLGNPFLRLKQYGKYLQLYPDLPLEFDENSGWESPDFYFIATPIMSQGMQQSLNVSTKKKAFLGPATMEYEMAMSPEIGPHIKLGETIIKTEAFDKTVAREGFVEAFGSHYIIPEASVPSSPQNNSSPSSGEASEDSQAQQAQMDAQRAQAVEFLKSMAEHPRGDETKSISDVDMRETLMSALSDLQRNDKIGTMALAYPAYAIFLIDEPRNLLLFRTFGDFYGRRSAVDIQVHTNQVPMYDTCKIVLTDVYHRATTKADEYEDRDLGQIIAAFNKFWDRMMQIFGMGPDKLDHIMIEPGMRLQVRMGYGSNINDYPVMFNGAITEVIPQDPMLTIVAQGDGRELLGIINPGDPNANTGKLSYGGLFGLMYSEPRDLMIKLLTLRGSVARDALALAMKGAIHPGSKSGIRHFGMLFFNDKPKDWSLFEGTIMLLVETLFLKLGSDPYVASAGGMTDIAMGQVPEDKKLLLDQVLGSIMFTNMDSSGESNDPMMYPTQYWEAYQQGSSITKFKAIFQQALMNIWSGWDTEIFKRNIYPGHGMGPLASGSTEGIISESDGGEPTNPWARLWKELGDTFDFMAAQDEPSVKIRTYQRTIWDIMLNACDVCPNYVLAVRPFEHRSTLYFGKQFWKYTSGVEPIKSYTPSDFANTPNIIDPSESTDLLIHEYLKRRDIVDPNATRSFAAISSGAGAGGGGVPFAVTSVNGQFINKKLEGTAMQGYGQLIADLAVQYGIPWEFALGVFWAECQYLSFDTSKSGYSLKWNNPGNIRYSVFLEYKDGFTATQATEYSNGSNDYTQYPNVETGIRHWFYYMSKRFPNKIAAGDFRGICLEYAPASDGNNTSEYWNTVYTVMTTLRSQAQQEGAIIGGGDAPIIVNGIPIGPDPWMANATGSNSSSSPTVASSGTSSSGQTQQSAKKAAFDEFYKEKFHTVLLQNTEEIINSTFKNIFDENCGMLEYEWGNYGWSDPLNIGKGIPVRKMIGDSTWDQNQSLFEKIKNGYTDPIGGMLGGYANPNDYSLLQQEKDFIGNMFTQFGLFLRQEGTWDSDIFPALMLDSGFKKFYEGGSIGAPGAEEIKRELINLFTSWVLTTYYKTGKKLSVNVIKDANGNIVDMVLVGGSESQIPQFNTLSPGELAKSYKTYKDMIAGLFGSIDRRMEDLPLIGDLYKFVKGIGKVLTSIIGLTMNILPFGIQVASLSKQMMGMQKLMDKGLLDSIYYKEGEADNPFTREFQEEVREVREPFARIHYSTSFTDMIGWNVSTSDVDVYPVVTATSEGKRPVTVYADKSIDSQYQREKIVESYLEWDIIEIPLVTPLFNFLVDNTLGQVPILKDITLPVFGARTNRDKIYAKRIALAHVARSLKTMYQGQVHLIGNPRIRPFDYIYLANAYHDYWGLAEVHSATHIMNSMMGYTTSIEINPIVIVDDPSTWSWTESSKRVMIQVLHPTLIKYATKNTNNPIKAQLQLNQIKNGMVYDIAVGGNAALANILAGGALDFAYWSQNKDKYGVGGMQIDQVNSLIGNILGIIGLGELNPVEGFMNWMDGQQDVYIGLLTHNGTAYHAGLKGANGIIIGEAQSTGFDLIDFFIKNRPDLTWDQILIEIGMNPNDIEEFRRRQQKILGDIFSTILSERGNSLWNTPSGGWYTQSVTVVEVKDGDTIVVRFPDGHQETIRFAGVDAWELDSDPRGIAAKQFTYSWIPIGTQIEIKSYPPSSDKYKDKYGRTLAWVYVNGMNLNIALYQQGLAYIPNDQFEDSGGIVN